MISIKGIKTFWIWVLCIFFALFLISSNLGRKRSWNPSEQVIVEIIAPFQKFIKETFNITEKLWLKYFGLIVDILYLILLYLFSYWLFNNILISILSSIIFLITPVFLLYYNRTFSISGRAIGELFFSTSIVFVIIFLIDSHLIYLFISSFFVCLVLISSRFAAQVTYFVFIFLAIIYSTTFFIPPGRIARLDGHRIFHLSNSIPEGKEVN